MCDGEVISLGPGCFQWTVDDFLSFVRVKERYLRSPVFRFSGVPYRMVLVFSQDDFIQLKFFHDPSDDPSDESSDDPSDEPSDEPSNLNVKLGMRTGYRGKMEYRSGETYDSMFIIDAWMPRSEFFERRCEILNDGCLTIFCKLRLDTEESASVLQEKLPSEEKITAENETSKTDSDEEVLESEWKTLKKMQRDLRNLLVGGEDCDVTIKIQGKEFPAHRNILRARSPVFKSMFSHETVEKQSGVVVIEDCDPGTFPDFLNYVYTGSIGHISDENVFRLYTVSDKYGVEELKEECATFMKSNMSVGTFCDVITLALRHTETELISLATAFFSANLKKIIKTVKWQTFLHENTTVGNELLIKALSN